MQTMAVLTQTMDAWFIINQIYFGKRGIEVVR